MIFQILGGAALLLVGFGLGYFVGYRQAKRGLEAIPAKPSL
jgi:hypothetical protein